MRRPLLPQKRADSSPWKSGVAAQTTCTPGDLLRSALLSGEGISGAVYRVRDGNLAEEGTAWNAPVAVQLKTTTSHIKADLRRVRTVRGLLVQGDNNDQIVVEGSADGEHFRALWTAPSADGVGLRTRFVTLSKPARARYLRVRARGGDGYYSVSEWRAYCKLPKPWPPAFKQAPKKRYWEMLTNPLMVKVQAAVGCAALLLLLLGFVVPYRCRPLRPHRLRDGGLLGAGALALLGAAHTGLWIFSVSAGALLLIWFGLRWASGSWTVPRWFAPVARAVCRPPASLLFSGLIGAAVAGVTYNFGVVGGAGAALVVVLLWTLLRMLREPVSFRRTARICLLFFGLFGLGSWWNFGHFHFDHFIHVWEQYHYVMGAKYGPELRYGRLYDCTTAADLADGLKKRVADRKVRRLATDNELGDTKAVIKDPGICTGHFTPERWAAFRKDIRFFRARFSQERWDKSQTDHGYNATPAWGVVARLIVDRLGDLTWRKIEYLGAIDAVLLLLMWAVIAWAFGLEAACVALIYWGLNYPARYYWNGGGFLRYTYLLWLGLGLCMLRKNRMVLGGVALTYATALRIFPGFVVAALVLKALARMVRERRFVLSQAHLRFAAGCLLAIVVLLPVSATSMGGLDAWPEFVKNSQKHMNTALTNNMGLKTVIGYDFGTRAAVMRDDDKPDPFKAWKDARKYFYYRRMPIFLAIVGLYCLLLARAVDRSADWEAACLGTGLIVMASELTCYYYAFLLAYGLMWDRRKLPGILAVAYAALTAFLDVIPWNDDRYTAMSLAAVVMVLVVTSHAAFGRSGRVALPEGQAVSKASADESVSKAVLPTAALEREPAASASPDSATSAAQAGGPLAARAADD